MSCRVSRLCCAHFSLLSNHRLFVPGSQISISSLRNAAISCTGCYFLAMLCREFALPRGLGSGAGAEAGLDANGPADAHEGQRDQGAWTRTQRRSRERPWCSLLHSSIPSAHEAAFFLVISGIFVPLTPYIYLRRVQRPPAPKHRGQQWHLDSPFIAAVLEHPLPDSSVAPMISTNPVY